MQRGKEHHRTFNEWEELGEQGLPAFQNVTNPSTDDIVCHSMLGEVLGASYCPRKCKVAMQIPR